MATLNSSGFGRLTADPILTDIPDKATGKVKTHVCKFSLAFNFSKDGKTEESHFFDFVIWDTGAENFAGRARKGDLIYVECEPREERWVKDDKKMKKVLFRVNRFKIFEKRVKEYEPTVKESEPVVQVNDYDEAPF